MESLDHHMLSMAGKTNVCHGLHCKFRVTIRI